MANAEQIKTGDIVRLRDAGTVMLVRAVSGDSAFCQWFSGSELKQGTFRLSSLQPANTERRDPGQRQEK